MPPLTCPQTTSGERHKGIRYVAVEINAHCNRKCSFCPTNSVVKFPKEFIEPSLFRKIIRELADWNYDHEVSLYGHGEALLHPSVVEYHSLVRNWLPRCRMSLSTNGDRLTEQTLKDLFKSGLNTLLVNAYDGFTFDHENMSKCAEANGIEVRWISTHPWAFPMQHSDRPLLILYNASEYSGDFPGISDRAGNVPTIKPKKSLPLAQSCERPFTHVHIKWNGDLILCCNDWRSTTVGGNLKTVSLYEAYNSPILEAVRTGLDSHNRLGSLCERCDWGNE